MRNLVELRTLLLKQLIDMYKVIMWLYQLFGKLHNVQEALPEITLKVFSFKRRYTILLLFFLRLVY